MAKLSVHPFFFREQRMNLSHLSSQGDQHDKGEGKNPFSSSWLGIVRSSRGTNEYVVGIGLHPVPRGRQHVFWADGLAPQLAPPADLSSNWDERASATLCREPVANLSLQRTSGLSEVRSAYRSQHLRAAVCRIVHYIRPSLRCPPRCMQQSLSLPSAASSDK